MANVIYCNIALRERTWMVSAVTITEKLFNTPLSRDNFMASPCHVVKTV